MHVSTSGDDLTSADSEAETEYLSSGEISLSLGRLFLYGTGAAGTVHNVLPAWSSRGRIAMSRASARSS